MRHTGFNRDGDVQTSITPHLYSPAGFLDDTYWHRTYWLYGTEKGSGAVGWTNGGSQFPSGEILVSDGTRVYGYGRDNYSVHGSHPRLGLTQYRLFAADAKPRDTLPPPADGEAGSIAGPLPVVGGCAAIGPGDAPGGRHPLDRRPSGPAGSGGRRGKPGGTKGRPVMGRVGVRWQSSSRSTGSIPHRCLTVWRSQTSDLYMALRDGQIVCLKEEIPVLHRELASRRNTSRRDKSSGC